jgi:predicted ATPase
LQFFILLTTEAMGHVGQVSQGLAELDEGIEQSEQTKERWLIADLLRIKGELLLLRGTQSAATAAEDHFRQALDWARRQSALSLELRAATSLARLLRDQGHSTDAVALLQQVYNRFTEGFDSADLKVARALLDALQ